MSAQIIEETAEVIFETTVNDDATHHLMIPADTQWMKLNAWFGNMKLIHQTALSIYQNRLSAESDAIIGGVISSIAGSPSLLAQLPSSAIGHKINEVAEWVADGYTDAEHDDAQSVTVSGHDFEVKADGTIWISGLGETSVVLTADEMLRQPVSIELFYNVMDDCDTAAIAVTYRGDAPARGHLSLVQ